ncbi:MAG: LytTR family DNA-binding domain-containing protein [Bacteroidota bacterium]
MEDYNNIAWVEGFMGYSKVFTKEQKCYVFTECLKYFEDRLPHDLFLRTCGSYIVNTSYVKRLFPQSGKTIAVMNDLNQVAVAPEKTQILGAMMLNNRKE